jgi:hypothetical protein
MPHVIYVEDYCAAGLFAGAWNQYEAHCLMALDAADAAALRFCGDLRMADTA